LRWVPIYAVWKWSRGTPRRSNGHAHALLVWAVVSLALAGLILAAFMSLHDIRAPEALQETRERWKPRDKEGALGGRGFESRRLALQLVPLGLAPWNTTVVIARPFLLLPRCRQFRIESEGAQRFEHSVAPLASTGGDGSRRIDTAPRSGGDRTRFPGKGRLAGRRKVETHASRGGQHEAQAPSAPQHDRGGRSEREVLGDAPQPDLHPLRADTANARPLACSASRVERLAQK
jgi:hypothetical protein